MQYTIQKANLNYLAMRFTKYYFVRLVLHSDSATKFAKLQVQKSFLNIKVYSLICRLSALELVILFIGRSFYDLHEYVVCVIFFSYTYNIKIRKTI